MAEQMSEHMKHGGQLRCSWCGVEIEERCEGYEVVNPGGRLVVLVHLCDACWRKYQEVKK